MNISEVQFAAPAAGAAPAAAAPVEAAPVEEEPEPVKIQTEFTLTMTDFDAKKKVKSEFLIFVSNMILNSAIVKLSRQSRQTCPT